MPVVGDLIVNLRAQTAQFNSAFTQSARSVEQTAQRIQRAGDRIARAGRNISIGVTAPLSLIGANAIRMASSVEESEQLFEVALGRMAGRARQFSQRLQEQFGLNAFAINRMVGTFDLMFKGMKINEEAALTMSTALTQLTLDMASLRNESIDDVFIKISAAITGQVEPLRRFGIIINETTAQQALLTRELIEQGQVLTEQEKIYGRFLAILDQSQADQGDLGRTILSTTNQWRVFKERLALVNVELGQVFLPFVNAALRVMNSMAKGFLSLDSGTKAWVAGLGALAAVLGPILLGLGLLVKSFGLILPWLGRLAGGLGFLVSALAGLAVAWEDTRTQLRRMFVSDETWDRWIQNFEDAFGLSPQTMLSGFVDHAEQAFRSIGAGIVDFVSRSKRLMLEFIDIFEEAFGVSLIDLLEDHFMAPWRRQWDAFRQDPIGSLQGVIDRISQFGRTLGVIFGGILKTVGNWVLDIGLKLLSLPLQFALAADKVEATLARIRRAITEFFTLESQAGQIQGPRAGITADQLVPQAELQAAQTQLLDFREQMADILNRRLDVELIPRHLHQHIRQEKVAIAKEWAALWNEMNAVIDTMTPQMQQALGAFFTEFVLQVQKTADKIVFNSIWTDMWELMLSVMKNVSNQMPEAFQAPMQKLIATMEQMGDAFGEAWNTEGLEAEVKAFMEEARQIISGIAGVRDETELLRQGLRSLESDLTAIDNTFILLGNRIDPVALKIEALTRALEEMVASGVSPSNAKLQELERNLTQLENVQRVADGVRTVGNATANAMQETVRGVLLGTQTIQDAFKNMAQNILTQIAVDFIDQGIRVLMNEMIQIVQQALIKAFGIKVATSLAGAAIGGVGGAAANFGGGVTTTSTAIPEAGQLAGIFNSAEGNIFTRPALTTIAEREPEAAIPLSKLPSMVRGMGGGGQVTITINNNTDSRVSAQSQRSGDDIDIEFTIDQVVAKNILRGNGPTARAMQSRFGLQSQGARR